MSFASKTRTQARTASRTNGNEYSAQFQAFSISALQTYESYQNTFHWANSQAKRFLTLYKSCPYSQAQVASDLRKAYESYDNLLLMSQKAETTLFTADGDPSYAEEALGKAKFNAFLFKEYDAWFPAFEAEAKDEGADIDTAEYRWTWQASQKLSKRTGLSMRYLEAVIGAWLLTHKSA